MKNIEFSTIDRLEGDMVVVELPDKQMIPIQKSVMPPEIKSGDKVFRYDKIN